MPKAIIIEIVSYVVMMHHPLSNGDEQETPSSEHIAFVYNEYFTITLQKLRYLSISKNKILRLMQELKKPYRCAKKSPQRRAIFLVMLVKKQQLF
ncbi:hypothetical protein TH62_01190 [Bacillus sp. TH008]|nr:hypothetical protein TH62_01190 [Bacillus sp. TH008]